MNIHARLAKRNSTCSKKESGWYFAASKKFVIPPDENYKDPECSVYYFCSNECVEDLKIKVSACERQARWKQLMGKISKVSIEKGLAGKRIHDLDNIK